MRQPYRIAPLLLLPTLFAAIPPLYAAPTQMHKRVAHSPQQAVTSFLTFHLSHSGGGLTPAFIKARKQWLAPSLLRLLEREMTRETAFRTSHPNDVPFLDGDVFLSAQDTPESYKVTAPVGHDVSVQFRYGTSTRTVRYRMRLAAGKTGKQWQIEDVIADGESLQKTLQRPNYETAGRTVHKEK